MLKKIYVKAMLVFCFVMLTSCTNYVKLVKPKPSNGSISKEITVKKGEYLSYEYRGNSSIGTSTKYDLTDKNILKVLDSEYKKDSDKPGAGYKEVFRFKAIKNGKTTLVIKDFYRGDLKEECRFIITIK